MLVLTTDGMHVPCVIILPVRLPRLTLLPPDIQVNLFIVDVPASDLCHRVLAPALCVLILNRLYAG